jgi:hypothetical protein
MSPNKTSLTEIASGSNAIKTARAKPIQQEDAPRQSMDFIRSLVLDIPIQTMGDVVETTPELKPQEQVPVTENEALASIKKLAGIR